MCHRKRSHPKHGQAWWLLTVVPGLGAAGGSRADRDVYGGTRVVVAVRPGRDRARPVRAARSVVVPARLAFTPPLAARLDPIEANSATQRDVT
ncbi:MAG: hypothetical protein ACRDRS_22705 [Pseudonocardiaceae bacterium]